MYKIPLAQIKEKVVASGKFSSAEFDVRIREKINELSGLISEEGAAHIIANELGIELVNQSGERLKIKEIYAGMRNVSCAAKVIRKYDLREFSKNDRTGKVCSLFVGDETGTIRVVFWNDQTDLVKDVQEQDIIVVKDAYVRENNNDREIHVGERGTLEINPDGVSISDIRQSSSFERRPISDLQDGQDGVEVMATIIQVFDPRFFFVDPSTGKRTEGNNGTLSYVMNIILDDGTGTVRGVFWKNQTEHLISKSEEDMARYREEPASFEDVKTDLLGEQVKVKGKVKRNQMFDRLELSVQMVEKADPEEELARLEKET